MTGRAATADGAAASGAAGSGPPLVSVVVTTRDRHDSLERMLASLARQTYPRLETIVYDDASDPPVRGAPGVTLLRRDEPHGACYGRNRCFEKAQGEFVLTLDDDVELEDPGLIARAVELAERHPDVAMLMFREVRPDGVYTNTPPGPEGAALQITKPGFYGCLIRTGALRRVGMYLVEEFDYCEEEVELAIRLLDAGLRIVYVPWLSLCHHGDERTRDWRRRFRLTARNTMLTALLRYPLRDLPRGLAGPVRMFCRRPPVDGRRDWLGLAWIAWHLLAKVPFALRHRAPIRHATLVRHRQIFDRPVPVELAPAPGEPRAGPAPGARPPGGPQGGSVATSRAGR
ncbi:MAG TPA: glycosyltransferase [Longimicrobium sp.]|jgi:GT2 family glycosyltransferase